MWARHSLEQCSARLDYSTLESRGLEANIPINIRQQWYDLTPKDCGGEFRIHAHRLCWKIPNKTIVHLLKPACPCWGDKTGLFEMTSTGCEIRLRRAGKPKKDWTCLRNDRPIGGLHSVFQHIRKTWKHQICSTIQIAVRLPSFLASKHPDYVNWWKYLHIKPPQMADITKYHKAFDQYKLDN